SWESVVGVDGAAGELNGGAIEQFIQQCSIRGDPKLKADTGNSRSDSEIVLGQINYAVGFCVIEAFQIQQIMPGGLFFNAQALPRRISFQVSAKVAQSERRVKLREGLRPIPGLDQSDLAHPLREIAPRQLALSGRVGVAGKRIHEGAPGKLSGGPSTNHA